MNVIISPFTPELGTVPLYVVERDVFQKFREALASAKKGKPKNILLIGGRGAGKTVTLKIFREIASTESFLPVFISCDESMATPKAVSRAIYRKSYEALAKELEETRIANLVNELTSKPSHVKEPESPLTPLGLQPTVDEYNLCETLKKLIGERRVAFLFDEAQAIFSKGVARYLINFFYSEFPDRVSDFVTVLGGTRRLERDVLETTPAYRAFPVYTLSPFTKEETKKLLQKCTENTPITFSDAVCENIWEDIYGLPHYIHYCGDWLYKAKGQGIVGEAFYKEHNRKMLKELGVEKLERRLQTMEEKGEGYREVYETIAAVAPAPKDIALRTISIKDVPTISQITERFTLETLACGSVGVYVYRLWREGELDQIARGCYIPSDPLLAEYAKKHRKY